MVASVWCCRAWSGGDPAKGRLLCLRPWDALSPISVLSLPCSLLLMPVAPFLLQPWNSYECTSDDTRA